MYMHTPAWESVRLWWGLAQKAEMTRQCLERCFQKDTVKKLWMLYRFNLQILVSYTCVANHHRSIILWSPIQFRVSRAPEPRSLILTQATATAKPAYLHPLKSVGVSVYFYVCVSMCAVKVLQTKLNTSAAGSCESMWSQFRVRGREDAEKNAGDPGLNTFSNPFIDSTQVIVDHKQRHIWDVTMNWSLI